MLYETRMKRLWIAGVTLALLCYLSQRLAANAIAPGLLDGGSVRDHRSCWHAWGAWYCRRRSGSGGTLGVLSKHRLYVHFRKEIS